MKKCKIKQNMKIQNVGQAGRQGQNVDFAFVV